jgi:hypothetical protein
VVWWWCAAFAHAGRADRSVLIDEVLGKAEADSPLVAMVKDQYANYVVQKMVDVVDEEQRQLIVARIRRHVPNLRKIPYGKHISTLCCVVLCCVVLCCVVLRSLPLRFCMLTFLFVQLPKSRN